MSNGNPDNTNGSSANWRADIDEFEQNLKHKCPKDDEKEKCQEDDPVIRSKKVLDNVAFHDFAFYEFLLDTSEGYGEKPGTFLSEKGKAYIEGLENQGVPYDALEFTEHFLTELETIIRVAIRDNQIAPQDWDSWFTHTTECLYDDSPHLISELMTVYVPEYHDEFFDDLYGEIRHQMLLAVSGRNSVYFDLFSLSGGGYSFVSRWSPVGQYGYNRIPYGGGQNTYGFKFRRRPSRHTDYTFEVFPSYSVNIGLRLVYRQEWKPLSTQPGEIVRTIPLGPGQKERVTTKITRRKKRTSTMETVTETETTTESTDTTKDSNEIVSEAASSFNWKVDAEVHGGISVIGGSASTSFGGSSEDKSKNTSSNLSETMQKSASKIRRETKVTVSTESEETIEREQFSEITNPNNEMAITYEYLKLQQQYEVFTYLAEVQSVIFVAEYLPPPSEIGKDWVRKHDWIIAKILKDESHRQTLNDLIQDVDEAEDIAEGAPEIRDFLIFSG